MIKDKHIEYQDELKQLRSERNQIRAKNSLSIKSTEEILETFDKDKGSLIITFDELHELKIGEVYDVNNGVSFIMESKSDNKLVFQTFMIESGEFGLQAHDCYEFCEIIKGDLIEKERGYKGYQEGDVVSYSPFEKHKPYSTKDSIYKVTFLKKFCLNDN